MNEDIDYLNILAVGRYEQLMPTLRALLSAKRLTVTVSEFLNDLTRHLSGGVDAAILFLPDTVNLQSLRKTLCAFPGTSFLLVSPYKPPRAAIARLAREQDAVLVAADDGPVVVVASLYAILAQRQVRARGAR